MYNNIVQDDFSKNGKIFEKYEGGSFFIIMLNPMHSTVDY